ncbi:hypothetical protein B0H65DRAFT_570127 [Neurospora tetraspora]|uniref:Uncharacterized protein n=1 Tax=Neurospora tetraspora TaxID=94610 RepID=A0AAE0JGT1_9PEZI|nr:hypothetical protein B0H65DRAFT_570127 [Neurospora tetraspora]
MEDMETEGRVGEALPRSLLAATFVLILSILFFHIALLLFILLFFILLFLSFALFAFLLFSYAPALPSISFPYDAGEGDDSWDMSEDNDSHEPERFFEPALFRELVPFFNPTQASSLGPGILFEEGDMESNPYPTPPHSPSPTPPAPPAPPTPPHSPPPTPSPSPNATPSLTSSESPIATSSSSFNTTPSSSPAGLWSSSAPAPASSSTSLSSLASE